MATARFFDDSARVYIQLAWEVEHCTPQAGACFMVTGQTPLNESCLGALQRAWQGYADTYVRAWDTAYQNRALPDLEQLSTFDQGWELFASQFEKTGARSRIPLQRDAAADYTGALAEILRQLRWPHYQASTRSDSWLTEPSGYSAQCAFLQTAFADALRQYWNGGDFIASAIAPGAASDEPWTDTATTLAGDWLELTEQFGATADLPERFPDNYNPPSFPSVPWGRLADTRHSLQLEGERLTDLLLGFEDGARGLLDQRLTDTYAGIQTHYFGRDQRTAGGWPYLQAGDDVLTALVTVDFDDFLDFLNEIGRAQDTLDAFEDGLGETPVGQTRRAFLGGCDDWRQFLQLSPEGVQPLPVSAWTEDPLDVNSPQGQQPVDDTAQHYYRQVRLSLGLRIDGSAKPLVYETGAAGWKQQIDATWEWSRGQMTDQLEFALTDGRPVDVANPGGPVYPQVDAEVIGRWSPLALCAFLQRYGNQRDGNWYVSFGLNLVDALDAKGARGLITAEMRNKPVVGSKFVFNLKRQLPPPIEPLAGR